MKAEKKVNQNLKVKTKQLIGSSKRSSRASIDELPSGSILQNAEVLRALLRGVKALEQQIARDERRGQLPPNVGQPWSLEEETRVVNAVTAGTPLQNITKELGRTPRSVLARALRLGLPVGDQLPADFAMFEGSPRRKDRSAGGVESGPRRRRATRRSA